MLYREGSLTHTTDDDEVDHRSTPERYAIDLTNPNDLAIHTVHQFPAGKVWRPQRLEVNGRKGRRVVCVVAEDQLHYRQLDIDSLKETNGEDDAADQPEADVAMSAT